MSPAGHGVYGRASAFSGTNYGVYGQAESTAGRGVYGVAGAASGTTYGVFGQSASTAGRGVYGLATATSGSTFGVYGRTDSPSGYGGYFIGNLHTTGTLSKAAGAFKIDHPLDPANQYLYHSFVESPDMLNIYNGMALLDDQGEADVHMPAWFEVLNRGFRYQLTPVGAAMPDLHIAQEVQGNVFLIAGGKPGMKVSWQVTGIRRDAYANAHASRWRKQSRITSAACICILSSWVSRLSLGWMISPTSTHKRSLKSNRRGSAGAHKGLRCDDQQRVHRRLRHQQRRWQRGLCGDSPR